MKIGYLHHKNLVSAVKRRLSPCPEVPPFESKAPKLSEMTILVYGKVCDEDEKRHYRIGIDVLCIWWLYTREHVLTVFGLEYREVIA